MNPTQLIENRSSLLIFRDCLKLASRMVDNPVKTQAVRKLIRQQFAKNRDVFDQQQIRNLKMNAVRGISNYIIYSVKEQYKFKTPQNIHEEHQPEQEEIQNQQDKH